VKADSGHENRLESVLGISVVCTSFQFYSPTTEARAVTEIAMISHWRK